MMTWLLFAAAQVVSAPAPAAPPIPPGCNSPESHQFDFWVGSWEVHANGSAAILAHSLVEKRYSGCAIRENWMPLGQEVAGGGGSLSSYDPERKQWRQAWVDSGGSRADFDGGLVDGTMTITGNWPNCAGPGKSALVKMRYRLQPDGEVRQWGESSNDGGKSWQASFDLLYRRAPLPKFAN